MPAAGTPADGPPAVAVPAAAPDAAAPDADPQPREPLGPLVGTPLHTESLPPLPPEMQPQPAPRSPSRVVPLVAAIAVVALGAGAAVLLLGGKDATPVEQLAPADSLAFVKVWVDPPETQRQALRTLLNRLPQEERDRLLAKIDEPLQAAFREDGIDYRKEIKPWVGGQIGVVVLPGRPETSTSQQLGSPRPVVAIAVKDEGAARAALQKTADDGVFEVSEGYAFIAETKDAIVALTRTRQGAPKLADSADYKRTTGALGDNLMTVYYRGEALQQLATSFAQQIPGFTPPESTASGVFALRAENEGLVLLGQTPATDPAPPAGGTQLIESVPADTLAALTFLDPGRSISGFLRRAQAAAEDDNTAPAGTVAEDGFAEAAIGITQILQFLGLDAEADIVPWLHGEVSLAVGALTRPPLPDLGLVVAPTDQAALDRTITALRERLGTLLAEIDPELLVTPTEDGFDVATGEGITVYVRRFPDRLVIATSEDYAGRLAVAGGPTLGQDAVYRRAVGQTGSATTFQLYVRVDRWREIVEGFMAGSAQGQQYEETVAPFLRPFEALVVQNKVEGAKNTFRILLTVADRS